MFCAAELIVKTEFTYSCWVWAKLSEAESFQIWQLLSWSWSEMVIFPPWLNQEDCSKKRDQWEEEPESVMSWVIYRASLELQQFLFNTTTQYQRLGARNVLDLDTSLISSLTTLITHNMSLLNKQIKQSQIKSTALKARCMLLMIFSERATCDHFLDRMNYCCSKPEWKLQIDNFMCS